MTTTRPELEQHRLAAIDAIDEPTTIATSGRDGDGRILGEGRLTTSRMGSASPEPG